jgi:hypothetical protein
MSKALTTYPGSDDARPGRRYRRRCPSPALGPAGRSKTALIEGAAKSWGRECQTIVGSTREAPDFLGVMVENNGVINYSSFEWVRKLNKAKKGLLFLDEFNTAAPSTMKGMLRVVQERYVGEEKLNDGVAIVAAANPVETAVDAYDLPAPMARILTWTGSSTASWLDNVAPASSVVCVAGRAPDHYNTRHASVVGALTTYLKDNPDELDPAQSADAAVRAEAVPSDPVKAGKAWNSPRSWTNLINVLSYLDGNDIEAINLATVGLVGEASALKFLVWLKTADLYDLGEVMNNPASVNWTGDRPDRLYALIQSITTLGLSSKELWRPAALVMTACAQAQRPDVALPGARKLMNKIPVGSKMPTEFRDAFLDLYEKTRHKVAVAS